MTFFGRRISDVAAHPAAADGDRPHSGEPESCDAARLLAARLDASRAALDRRLERLTREARETTGRRISLTPLMLIPEPCWRGRYGKFLLQALELSPYDPWNVAALPALPADAVAIEAPPHPGAPTPQDVHAVNDAIADIKRGYHEGREQMEWTNDPADVVAAHQRAVDQVKGLAADRLTALYPQVEEDAAPAGADATP